MHILFCIQYNQQDILKLRLMYIVILFIGILKYSLIVSSNIALKYILIQYHIIFNSMFILYSFNAKSKLNTPQDSINQTSIGVAHRVWFWVPSSLSLSEIETILLGW